MKNVLIVVDNLVMGGVTKVLVDFLKEVNFTKYKVDLCILHYYKDMSVEIPKEVKIIEGTDFFCVVDERFSDLKKNGKLLKIIKKILFAIYIKTGIISFKIKQQRRVMFKRDYDVEIAFNDGFSQIFTANGDTKKKIAWLHSDLRVKNYSANYYNILKKSILKFDLGLGVSNEVCESYREVYSMKNLTTIENFVDYKSIIEKSNEKLDFNFDENTFNMISVGRLDYPKNYDRLIRVHKKLIDNNYKVKTYIVGEGNEREKLQNLIRELGVDETFFLLGRKDNPYKYVKRADLFVLSSRYEGLPTVITEAMILKVPCISTKVAGVQRQLQELYGLVVENSEDALYNGISQLLQGNNGLLKKYKQNLENYEFNNNEALKKIDQVFGDEIKNED
ncbi:MAG: glycosyltransferase [Clostridia bacterium]|nr:glycosyltransferase [Clostridia bacterium]